MLAVDQQPFIVFTPSTPTLSSTTFEDAAVVHPSHTDGSQHQNPHRRASFFRSHSVRDSLQQASTPQPVVLHRPSSSLGSRWTFAKARHSFLESCWRSERGGSAVASAINDNLNLNEKPPVATRTMSDSWAAGAQASWVDVDDDGDFSEPESTPSTPVFPHRVLSSSSTLHGSRVITLISAFVIALAFASLAFTTFFHPTFGDKISKLPETGDVDTPHAEEAWSHRFFHFDGVFGHSDDDGLVGISSNVAATGSNDASRELRKRASPSSADYYGDSLSSVVDEQPGRRWMPWHWSSDASSMVEDDEKVAFEHRRSVDQAAQRMERRRAALEKRLVAQRRW